MTSPALAAPPLARPTLLFVDDEERILRSLKMMFSAQYNVRTTTSGVEALDILKRERVHALVSDQRMPIMPGVELLRQARNVAPNTMRLLLTGYADLEAVAGSINEGEVFRYISKPWNPSDIRLTIGNAVDIALQLDNPEPPLPQTEAGETQRLLVIDDDPEVASQIKTLADENLPGKLLVDWASDVDSALRALERGGLSMVITDVRLGGEDITGVVKLLKQRQPDVITLALTHYQDSATLVNLINQAQIHRFLLKPVRPHLTWRGIESGLKRHRELRAAPQLARQHTVEKAALDTAMPTARRILGFFRGLGRDAKS